MNKKSRWIAIGIVCIVSFSLIFTSQIFADEIEIVGEINEKHQIVTKDNTVYDVADTEISDDLMSQVDVGQKVKIKGTVTEKEGQKVIDVTSYELIEE